LTDIPWRPDYVTKVFGKLRTAHNLPSLSFKDLRHYQATMLLANGAGLPTVQKRLGHARGGATTLKVYAHSLDEHDRQAALIIEDQRRQGRTG
jgi:integrase